MSHQIKINLETENSASQTLQPIIISWTNPSTDNQSQMIDETRIKQEDELQIISQVIQEIPHPATRKSAEIVSPTRVLRSHGKADKSPVIVKTQKSRNSSKSQNVEVFTKVVDISTKSVDKLTVNGNSSPWVTTLHKKSASQSRSQAKSNKIQEVESNSSAKKVVKILPKETESIDEFLKKMDSESAAKGIKESKTTKTLRNKQVKKDKNGNSLKIANLASKTSTNSLLEAASDPIFEDKYIKKEMELDIGTDESNLAEKLIKIEDTNQFTSLTVKDINKPSSNLQISTNLPTPTIKNESNEEVTIKVTNITPKSEVKLEMKSENNSCISETNSSPLKYFNVSSSSKIYDLGLNATNNKFVHLSNYLSNNIAGSLNVDDNKDIKSEPTVQEPSKFEEEDDDDDDEDRLVIKEEDDIETIDISDSDDEKPEESAPKRFQNSWTNLNSLISTDSNSLTSSNHVSISYPSIDGSTSLQPPVIQISYQFPMDSQHSASSTQIQKHFMSSGMEPIHKNLGQQSTFGQLFTKKHHHGVQPVTKHSLTQNLDQSKLNLSVQPSTSQFGASNSSNKPQTSNKRRRSSLLTPSTSKVPQTSSKSLENPSKKAKTIQDIPIIPYIPPTILPRRMSSTSSDGSSSTSHPFQCKMCMAIFKRKIDMIHHLKSHSEAKYECQRCGMKFKFEGYFLKHKCIACTLCDKTFFLKQQLRNHQRNEHDIQMAMYECDLCGKTLRYRHGVLYHMSKTHMKYLEDKYGCDVCGKRFKLKESIRLHIKNHESVIECELCDKKVKRVNLNVHMKSVHVTERNFKCRICRTSFKTKECLKSHIRTHEKSFECTECGKRFSNKSHLKEHMEWHRNPEAYKCKICQKSFAQKYCLKAHVKLHESGHLFTKFKCSSCPYSTDKAENLEKHELKHKRQEENEEMRKNWLQCEKCPVKLKNKLKLATHYWKKHSEVMPK